MSDVKGTVVLDPGHGGTENIDGSDFNHAISPSGVLEKTLTLQIAELVEQSINNSAPGVKVIKTRSGDVNLGLAARAKVAHDNNADLFLSIHFNGFNGSARGVEAFVRSKAKGNVNLNEDLAFATRIKNSVLAAIRARDPNTRDRDVKEMQLGVLSDPALGNTAGNHPCRACLLEVEFMDVPAVERLLITGPNAAESRQAVADAIKDAIVAELAAS